jgi:hypothetical protein
MDTNTKLYLALTESKMTYSWEGQTEVDNCERKLLPDANGYAIDMTATSTLTVPFTLYKSSSWVKANCKVIAFIQNSSTKEIYNTQVVDLNSVLPVQLVNFTGRQNNGNVLLTWETKTEIQNSGFNIERKTVKDNQFHKIGFIKGSGNSNASKNYSWSDNPVGGGKMAYRLGQINNDGFVTYSDIVEVNIAPSEYNLSQNYPNPFNPSTVIKYELPFENNVNIRFYNSLGQCIREVNEANKQPGYYEVNFNAAGFASGVYFYSLKAVSSDGKINYSSFKKMIIMK